jgi:hypothetical protein
VLLIIGSIVVILAVTKLGLAQGELDNTYLPLALRVGDTSTPEPTATITGTQSVEPTATPTATGTQSVEPTATSTPTGTQSVEPTATSTATGTQSGEPTATPADTQTFEGVIADHTSLASFESIPDAYLQAAAALDTLFMHQSVGNNIDNLGLGCLAGLHDDPDMPEECSVYAQNPYQPYDNRNWNWQMWDEPMADAIAKTDQWVSVVNAQQQNYQVLGMKFCFVDSWNQDFTYYRTNMEQLQQAYPQKIFIWATESLYAQSDMDDPGFYLPNAQNIQDFNQQLRAYAQANNIFLYDLADIESHDPDGNYCQSHDIEALCEVYNGGIGGGGSHPGAVGSIRLAKGFWYLMARIAGWNGN